MLLEPSRTATKNIDFCQRQLNQSKKSTFMPIGIATKEEMEAAY